MLQYLFYLVAYPLLLVLSTILGRIAAGRSLKRHRDWKPLGMENGILGFYALLTSFTLVQAGNQARDRELMVHTVADDISEILRTGLTYEHTLNASIRAYFTDFYKIIQEPFKANRESISQRLLVIDKRDDTFDAEMQRYILDHPAERGNISNLLSRIDKMESIYYRFMHSYHRTMPKMILLILVLFSLLIGFLMGFAEKLHGNRMHISTIIFVIISVIILNVIHDLDNPAFGFLKPSIEDIGEMMETYGISP